MLLDGFKLVASTRVSTVVILEDWANSDEDADVPLACEVPVQEFLLVGGVHSFCSILDRDLPLFQLLDLLNPIDLRLLQ